MVSYRMDTQLKKELTAVIRGEKYYATIRGILTVSGTDVHTGEYRTYAICLNGEFKKKFVSDSGRTWAPRFEGRALQSGQNALIDGDMAVEFPICDSWNSRQIARSMALNIGIMCDLEI